MHEPPHQIYKTLIEHISAYQQNHAIRYDLSFGYSNLLCLLSTLVYTDNQLEWLFV